MPVGISEHGRGYHQLICRVRVVRGEVIFRMDCSPASDYALEEHETGIIAGGACFRSSQFG